MFPFVLLSVRENTATPTLTANVFPARPFSLCVDVCKHMGWTTSVARATNLRGPTLVLGSYQGCTGCRVCIRVLLPRFVLGLHRVAVAESECCIEDFGVQGELRVLNVLDIGVVLQA